MTERLEWARKLIGIFLVQPLIRFPFWYTCSLHYIAANWWEFRKTNKTKKNHHTHTQNLHTKKTEENSHYCLPSHNDLAKATLVSYPVQARVLLINSGVTEITTISHAAIWALLWLYLLKKLNFYSYFLVHSSAFKEGQSCLRSLYKDSATKKAVQV